MASAISTIPKIHYEAKWPDHLNPAQKSLAHKVARLVWDFISVIIFPIFLLRITYKWLKNKVLRVIVPGNIDKDLHLIRFKSAWEWIKAICLFLYSTEKFKINREEEGKRLLSKHGGHSITLITPDKVKLDGAFYPGKIKNKAIIYAPGRGGQWENSTQKLEMLLKLNTSLVVVNPRGVGKNRDHRSEEGYALDTFSAADFLVREKKFDPNDIVFFGFSMGAGYSSCAASIFQKQYPDKKINVLNMNSFSDLQKVVDRVLQGRSLLKAIGRIASKILPLNLYPKSAWDKIKGKKCIVYNSKDSLIPKPVSLYQAVKEKPVGTTQVIRLHGKGLENEHNRFLDKDEVEAIQTSLMDMLNIDRSQTRLRRVPVPTDKIKRKTLSPKTA